MLKRRQEGPPKCPIFVKNRVEKRLLELAEKCEKIILKSRNNQGGLGGGSLAKARQTP